MKMSQVPLALIPALAVTALCTGRAASLSAGESEIPAGADKAPYPKSQIVRGIRWDKDPIRLANNAGDNWPITWGDGDKQYAAYGDGRGFDNRSPRLSLGFAVITGDPPQHRGKDLPTDIDTPEGQGPNGIKASGLLMIDGVLYLFVRNYKVNDNWRHSRLARSKDGGKSWTWADWHFAGTFGCPDFVQFGMNYRGARDSYVYLVSPDADSSYAYSPHLVLARVAKNEFMNRAGYEFFAGLDSEGRPLWKKEIGARQPIFTDPQGTQRVSITYNAALRRYFLTTSHRREGEKGTHTPALGVFDASQPWGPWTTVYYDDRWSGDNVTFHHKFPTKWMSPDGRTMWLLYSGLGGGNYAFCLKRAVLELY